MSLLGRTLTDKQWKHRGTVLPPARTPLSHSLLEERKNIFLLQQGGVVKLCAKLNTLLPQQALNATVTWLSFLYFVFSRKHCARLVCKSLLICTVMKK